MGGTPSSHIPASRLLSGLVIDSWFIKDRSKPKAFRPAFITGLIVGAVFVAVIVVGTVRINAELKENAIPVTGTFLAGSYFLEFEDGRRNAEISVFQKNDFLELWELTHGDFLYLNGAVVIDGEDVGNLKEAIAELSPNS